MSRLQRNLISEYCSIWLSPHEGYRQVSNIRRTIPQHSRFSYCLAAFFAESLEARCQVENEHVVGAALTGDAPTSSEWSTILLPTKVWLILEVLRYIRETRESCPSYYHMMSWLPKIIWWLLHFKKQTDSQTHQKLIIIWFLWRSCSLTCSCWCCGFTCSCKLYKRYIGVQSSENLWWHWPLWTVPLKGRSSFIKIIINHTDLIIVFI